MSKRNRFVPSFLTTEQVRTAERERRNAVAVKVVEESLAPPKPEAVTVEDPNVFDFNEYRALVKELGVNDSAVRNYEFRAFLQVEGITVYPMDAVTRFMDAKVDKEKRATGNQYLSWTWKPICGGKSAALPARRALDNQLTNWISSQAIRQAWVSISDEMPIRATGSGQYSRPIPHAVLLTVKKIRDRFGDAVDFYASDYEVRVPDPFLMVTGPGLDQYVIERWDEPGFRS